MKDEKEEGIWRSKKCMCQKLREKGIALEVVKEEKTEQSRRNKILK